MPPGCAPELAAISGLPAITLPCGVSRIGLPVGMEMLSVQENETALMVLALACEGRWTGRDRYKKPAELAPCGLSALHRVILVITDGGFLDWWSLNKFINRLFFVDNL